METHTGGKARILVVEDNPGDVELLRWALASAEVDCELTVIDNGGDARELVQQRGKYAGFAPPDLAIIDLNIPMADGVEILAAMRGNPGFAEVPVAILSSSASPRDRANIEAFHVRRYILKPPDLDEYMRIGPIVKELLTENRARTAQG